MHSLYQDLLYGVRTLKSKPGFTLVAVVTLALGIGANTAIFSVINAVILRPLPYPNADRLVNTRSNQSALNLADIKEGCRSFDDLGGITTQALDYTGGDEPTQIQAGLVTGGYFNTLGVRPVIGRVLNFDDDREGGERVIVISYGLWQRQFGGDRRILEQTVALSGNSYRIVGVMPADFRSPREMVEAWSPLRVVYPLAANARNVHFLTTYLRLKGDVTVEEAQAEMSNIDAHLAASYPFENKSRQTLLIPLQERIVGKIREPLLILFGAVGLVLLIACANFANLLLVRASTRRQEMVIRSALGASRARLIRQALTESVLIACLGGLAGAGLAWLGLDLLVSLKPANLPRLEAVGVDWRVILFTSALAIVTGLLSGLAPALTTPRVNLIEALKGGGRAATAGSSRGRLRNLLVVAEMALAVVLLVGAGLLLRSLASLQRVDPGFDKDNLLTMRIDLPEARYKEISKQIQYRTSVLDAVNALPGVEAAMISELPMAGSNVIHNFIIEGRLPVAPGEEPEAATRSVTHQYFDATRMRLLNGRKFTAQDTATSTFVCILNESAARVHFDSENPVGKRLRWAAGRPDAWMTVIGVVGDVKHYGFDQPEQPAVYTLYEQQDQLWKRWAILVARGQTDIVAMSRSIKEKIWSVDSQIPVTNIRTMTQVMGEALAVQQFNMLLLGIFAMVALALAAVGIYGVISYSVNQRRREIGIRLAMGAQASNVKRLFLKEGLTLAAFGIALGLAASLALTRLMRALLFGVAPDDLITFVAVAFLLLLIAVIACYVPARRATKVDPMMALRYE